ncbi:MAG: cell wall-active antibiotics response protein [Spirochaetaceae bacterium]|jgi:hypothetical protein|nr:cell wall-active antibiotics response protein [Spirochaetaceae bacterium]
MERENLTLEARKERAVKTLSEAFSRSALGLDEYERLTAYISRLESDREMAVVEKVVEDTVLYADGPEVSRAAGAGLTLLSARTVSADAPALKKRRLFLNVLGNTTIIIRPGDLPKGRTVLRVAAVLGITTIIVPPEVRITIEAASFLGGIFLCPGAGEAARPDSPELVVTGGAYGGNISIRSQRLPP